MAIYDASNTNKSKRSTRLYKDLDLDFSRNPVTNDIVKIEDVDAVKRSVKNLVQLIFMKDHSIQNWVVELENCFLKTIHH